MKQSRFEKIVFSNGARVMLCRALDESVSSSANNPRGNRTAAFLAFWAYTRDVLLQAVVEEGTAQSAKELKRPVYGKTGTTNDYTDAWFIGFDDRLVVGVWVGRDDHTPIGSKETGARAALPIWIEFMKKAPLQTLSDQNL